MTEDDDEELHEELLRLFRDYYKANLSWKNRKTKKACVETRVILAKIRRAGLKRREFLLDWMKDDTVEKWSHNNNPTGAGSVVAGKYVRPNRNQEDQESDDDN